MTDDVCRFSLIFPSWLGTVMLLVGLVLAGVGLAFLRSGARTETADRIIVKLWIFEFSTGIVSSMIVAGILLVLLGIAGISATYHQPFARWLGSMVTGIIDTRDPPVSGEFNNVPIGTIEDNLRESGLYAVQPTAAAKREEITGVYKSSRCYADLFIQICHQASQRLACILNKDEKVIRVCKLPYDAECVTTK